MIGQYFILFHRKIARRKPNKKIIFKLDFLENVSEVFNFVENKVEAR